MAKRIPIEDRIRAHTAANEAGCWIWTAAKSRTGYGVMIINRRQVPVHRVTYQLWIGPIPAGLHIDHLCRVRECVNPWHLEPVTPRENVLRGVGLAAENARKTQCKWGHPFDTANTGIRPNGGRSCRRCKAISASRKYHRDRGREAV